MYIYCIMFYTSHLIIDIYRGSARKTVILIHGLASCALRGKTSGTGGEPWEENLVIWLWINTY